MTGLPRSCSDKLEAQRLKTKINLRIHQTTRVNREHSHLFAQAFIYSIVPRLWNSAPRSSATSALRFSRSRPMLATAATLPPERNTTDPAFSFKSPDTLV